VTSQPTPPSPSKPQPTPPKSQPTPPSPPHPQPSQHYKRNTPLAATCRPGWQSCPVYTGTGAAAVLSQYECVNVASDLESCGGCVDRANPLASAGRDCSAIPNVDAVSCANSACVIEACKPGFALSADGRDCVAAVSAHRRRKQGREHAL
jgi:hypothetical protein